jgi:TfoX/Sxy family transcriptional regulator of competence genes
MLHLTPSDASIERPLQAHSGGSTMRFEKPPPQLVAIFDRALARSGGDRRQMFGYPCGFENDQMYCGVFGSTLFVRLDEPTREDFLKRGAKPFEPLPGRRMKEYVVLPAAVVEDEAVLVGWFGQGRAYARSLPARKVKPARSPSAPRRAKKGSGAKPRPVKFDSRRR